MAGISWQQEKRPLHHDFRMAGAAGSPQSSRGPDHVHVLQNGFSPHLPEVLPDILLQLQFFLFLRHIMLSSQGKEKLH